MRSFAIRLLKDQRGTATIEYGVIATLVGVVLFSSLRLVGTALTNVFSSVGNSLNSAAG